MANYDAVECWLNGVLSSDDGGGRSGWIEPTYGWAIWCLGHNFDVVGAILSMAHLSWQKGFDAGQTLGQFFNPDGDIEDNRYAIRFRDV